MFKKKKQPSKEPAAPVLVESREHERSLPTNEVCMGKLLEGALVHVSRVLFGPFHYSCDQLFVPDITGRRVIILRLLKFYSGIRNLLHPGFILETNLYQSVRPSLSAIS